MAGRNHLPNHLNHREIPLQRVVSQQQFIVVDGIRRHHTQPQQSQPQRTILIPSASRPLIEERIAAEQRELQTLLLDNQQLAANHIAIEQDLVLAEQELRNLTTVAGNVKAERDAEVREIYERSLRMEAEARSIEGIKLDLEQVKEDVKILRGSKGELEEKLKAIEEESTKMRPELKDIEVIKGEVDTMRLELQKGRAAVEIEKKTHAANAEQRKAMEKHIKSIRSELEKLRTDLDNAEKKAEADTDAAATATSNPNPGYVFPYGNPTMGYGGGLYPFQYAVHQVPGGVPLPLQYQPAAHTPGPPQYRPAAVTPGPPQYRQGVYAPGPPQYPPAPIVQGQFNMQQPHGPI